MHQPAIILDALLEPDEQFAEAVVPGTGALHDPAPRRMPPVPGHNLSAMPDVGGVATRRDGGLDLRKVIPLVEAQVLKALDRGPRSPDREAVAERHRLQPGEPLAPARAAETDRHVVVDEPAAAVDEDGRPACETCAVLLAIAGGRASDADSVRSDPAAADGAVGASGVTMPSL